MLRRRALCQYVDHSTSHPAHILHPLSPISTTHLFLNVVQRVGRVNCEANQDDVRVWV